jgi:uncharacterized membrane protein
MSILPNNEGAARARWLLLASLALNGCFVGAAGAVALRYTGEVPLSAITQIDHSATDRLDRLAASLPSTDAELMRSQLRADEERVAAAQADLRLAQDVVRNTLRAEPFDINALRAAMQQVQMVRENYHLVLHEVIEAAAPKMSVLGRNKLADWSAMRGNVSP